MKTQEIDNLDRGADGPAARARPRGEVRVAIRGASSARSHAIHVIAYRDQCELDRLARRLVRPITRRQHAAGLKFRALWRYSAGEPRVIGSYGERLSRGPGADLQAGRSDARAQVDAALEAIDWGSRLAVVAVCGCDEPARGRITSLLAGLDTLAEWWGIDA